MIKAFLKTTKNIWLLPCIIMGLLILANVSFQHYADYLTQTLTLVPELRLMEHCFYCIVMAFCQYWLIARVIERIFHYLAGTIFFQRYETGLLIMPFFVSVLKTMIFLILVNILTQKLILPEGFYYLLNKASSILIICSISGILFKIITVAEQVILTRSKAELSGIVVAKKIYTQTLILKRVAYSIVGVLTIGTILILFDNVRALGASVLTTAGVFGLVLTFTAQRSLGSIFSGLELALIQPINIGDKIRIEGKEGIIKEMNFRNVVLKLADWSHFSVPTNFFLEKPFQNWNHVEKTNLLGSAVLYVDYRAPIAKIRHHLLYILKQSPLWDKNIGRLKVSQLQKSSMQLKAWVSAENADDLSELLAYVREKLVSYLVENCPDVLPKTRIFTANNMDKVMESSFTEEEEASVT